jgi:hypothetical protein
MKSENFYRGSIDVRVASHVVTVTTRNGAQIFRRVSLTAAQMGQVEARLMVRQHEGDIRSYSISAAEDISFDGLLVWVESFRESGQQQELLNVSVGTLFSGDAA